MWLAEDRWSLTMWHLAYNDDVRYKYSIQPEWDNFPVKSRLSVRTKKGKWHSYNESDKGLLMWHQSLDQSYFTVGGATQHTATETKKWETDS